MPKKYDKAQGYSWGYSCLQCDRSILFPHAMHVRVLRAYSIACWRYCPLPPRQHEFSLFQKVWRRGKHTLHGLPPIAFHAQFQVLALNHKTLNSLALEYLKGHLCSYLPSRPAESHFADEALLVILLARLIQLMDWIPRRGPSRGWPHSYGIPSHMRPA